MGGQRDSRAGSGVSRVCSLQKAAGVDMKFAHGFDFPAIGNQNLVVGSTSSFLILVGSLQERG